MYAVIRTGGKQYRVTANDTIRIEKLKGSAGDSVEFTDVLMVSNGDSLEYGTPLVSGATVAGEILAQERGPKLVIFKKRRRKHYRRKNGHRQDLTSVRITEILTGGAKPARTSAVEPAKAPEAEAKPAEMAEAEAKPAETVEAAALAALPAEAKADDLSLIGGIGPKILMTLTEMGYTSFAQIAALGPEEIEKIETAIKAKGRVARDEWIDQAKELMAGKPPRAKADKAKAKE
jgi:large subunit ribosomal protein L21